MSEPFAISPELRELLGVLASDDQAGLLRSKASLGLSSPLVAASAPFLRSAERKLLDAHREEAARLLYGMASVLIKSTRDGSRLIHYREESSRLDRRELLGRIQRMAAPGFELGDDEASALVRACSGPGAPLDALRLAATALRLAPSNSQRVLLGLATFVSSGDVRAARRMLNEALDASPQGRIASYSLENLGLIEMEGGRFDAAARLYEAASARDPERVIPRLSWLNASLLCGDEDRVAAAAEELDAVPVPPGALDWSIGERNQLEELPHSPRARPLVERFADRYGPVSRKVFDAFR